MKKLFLMVSFLFLILPTFCASSLPTTLNVLSPMRVLDPRLIAQFEKAHGCRVSVEFVSDRASYESHLRSEIRVFDVVIADERSLIQLTTTNLLRTLPEGLKQSNDPHTPLQVKTLFNSEVNTYIPLFVNPMGIVYNPAVSRIPENPTWNLLIEPKQNPHWRQRIYMTNEGGKQIALALLASHEALINPKKLPAAAVQWLSKLRSQRAIVDEPLEIAFLGQHVNAAVLSYSDYLKYKNLLPHLRFVIPADGTYFDRFGIGWCLSSPQEKLAQKFISFMVANSAKFAQSNHLIDIKYGDKSHSAVKLWQEVILPQNFTSWTLYDESGILPFLPAQG